MSQIRESRIRAAWNALGLPRERILIRRQVSRVERFLMERARSTPEHGRPVVCFNASTRIHHLSQNAGFQLLAAWAVRLSGVPWVQLVCNRGMLQCMLGTRREDLTKPPPCTECVRSSRFFYPPAIVEWLSFDSAIVARLGPQLESASLDELMAWEHSGLPLGVLCLPSLRWGLRQHHLQDDRASRFLLRQYLLSAASLADRIEDALRRLEPRSLVLFNGVSYPEAVARELALRAGIPVVTHEVGLRPFSAFFSHEHATFREVSLPKDFQLTDREDRRLDRELESRFQGRFSMAGVKFWPEIHPIPPWLERRIKDHRQTITIFTNVVFDTSQAHANVLFNDMFDWLSSLVATFKQHPDILFILRAHPDEDRPGKESQESVAAWVRETGVGASSNVVFLEPNARISSYDLMMRSKFVMVYNSSVGLEASLAGLPVLCAGRARYTQVPTVFFPGSRVAYHEALADLLAAPDIKVPGDFLINARRLFYYESYHASLSFESFMSALPQAPGNVLLRSFEPEELARSAEVAVLQAGILNGEPFVLPWSAGKTAGANLGAGNVA